nr:putative auxin-responsive-like protein [uncultured bacterium]
MKIKANNDYQTFTAKVPVVDYDDFSEWIERQKKTEDRVIVSEPVLFYEKTSGSSAAAKFIPYTKSLKNSFNRMFVIWLADLLENGPDFKSGKSFISISPAFHQSQNTERGVQVGLEDDTDYLNPWLKFLTRAFFVLPSSIKKLQNPENFKRACVVLLLAEKNLEVISIWNPSFLEVLLDFIQANSNLLIADLRRGSLTVENINFNFKQPDARQLSLLEGNSISWENIWPELKLISCWTSANAREGSKRLATKFPQVFLQGKGLLATEAPLTLPLIEAKGFVPMLSEVFFEFIDEQGNIKLLHELNLESEYEVVLTQQGGLYRYRIGDRVRVTGYFKETPCLEFTGRSQAICDLVGEKLNEQFVQDCLARLSLQSHFQILLPVIKDTPHYLLLRNSLPFTSSPDMLEIQLDNLLCEAFHYRQARMLGQLGSVKIRTVANARDDYYNYFISKGMKFGDIKHRHLISDIRDAEKLMEKFGLS